MGKKGKGKEAEGSNDTDEDIETAVSTEVIERVEVNVDKIDRTWWDNYLRGVDQEKQLDLIDDVTTQMEHLNEGDKSIWWREHTVEKRIINW